MHRENSRLSHVSHHFRGGQSASALATATLTRESQCSLYVTNAGSDLALASCIFLYFFLVHYLSCHIGSTWPHLLLAHLSCAGRGQWSSTYSTHHPLCASRTPKVRLYQPRKYLPHGTAEVWNPVWWLLFMSSRWSLLKTFGNAYPPSGSRSLYFVHLAVILLGNWLFSTLSSWRYFSGSPVLQPLPIVYFKSWSSVSYHWFIYWHNHESVWTGVGSTLRSNCH